MADFHRFIDLLGVPLGELFKLAAKQSTSKSDEMANCVPKIVELPLSQKYKIMYENFVVATQDDVYLLLEKKGDDIAMLHFDSPHMKYGRPNDEARGGHPLCKYGLGFYGFFKVENSPWIREQMIANRVHDRHTDSLFDGYKHYIVCFKDVMLEVTCRSYEEKQMSMTDFFTLVNKQLDYLT